MPNRVIKESSLASRDLNALSDGAERLFWRLLLVADDFGRFDADPHVVKARCFPLKVDRIKTPTVNRWLTEIVTATIIQLYQNGHNTYGFFVSWDKHQQKRALHSKYPNPIASDSICNHLLANASENRSTPRTVVNYREAISLGAKGARDASVSELDLTAQMDAQGLFDGWNDICAAQGLGRVQELTKQRQAHIRLRLHEHPAGPWWEDVLNRITETPFLMGRNDRKWSASFDWLIANDTNAVKVTEGKYVNK